ncbi:MarR family transcriptional regulator [Dellaglioa algida]|uniref:MarR family transcriptional regulator n=1 Tax=Dellaglioa algida TaxID=105612 RepID=UPI0024DE00AB|nr:MarR family transcriptional regulator [Dellaglioa algida]MDK1740568.1 MarR family transcriptional regulator [Dellaglioa algida]
MTTTKLMEDYIDMYLGTFKYVEGFISQPTSEYNLSFEQFLILKDIQNTENISMVDIAKKRNVSRSAIARQLNVLKQLQYIYQEQDTIDRRRINLRLADQGAKVERVVTESIKKRFDTWVDVLGEGKVVDLLGLMREFGQKIMVDGR